MWLRSEAGVWKQRFHPTTERRSSHIFGGTSAGWGEKTEAWLGNQQSVCGPGDTCSITVIITGFIISTSYRVCDETETSPRLDRVDEPPYQPEWKLSVAYITDVEPLQRCQTPQVWYNQLARSGSNLKTKMGSSGVFWTPRPGKVSMQIVNTEVFPFCFNDLIIGGSTVFVFNN